MNDKEKVEVMLAHLNGAVIEYRMLFTGEEWRKYPSSNPQWNWVNYEYRVFQPHAKTLMNLNDLPPIFWITNTSWRDHWNLVIGIDVNLKILWYHRTAYSTKNGAPDLGYCENLETSLDWFWSHDRKIKHSFLI